MFQPCPGMSCNRAKHAQLTRAKGDMGLGRAMISEGVQFELLTARKTCSLKCFLLCLVAYHESYQRVEKGGFFPVSAH